MEDIYIAYNLERTDIQAESPLEGKDIKPDNPKGNQPWIFIGRTDPEAEAPILWPPDAKSWFIGKDPDAGRDWGQEEKGMTEDEMIGWHHQLNGHEFEQALGDSEGQGKPGMLQSTGSQRVRHGWVTEQQHKLQIIENISKFSYVEFNFFSPRDTTYGNEK